jgi:hypothetical protein
MAVSNLKNTIKGMVDVYNALHADKKIDWLPSREMIVKSLDNQLNNGKIELNEAMMKIRSDFHKEFIDKKVDEFSFFRAIEKETRYRLSK